MTNLTAEMKAFVAFLRRRELSGVSFPDAEWRDQTKWYTADGLSSEEMALKDRDYAMMGGLRGEHPMFEDGPYTAENAAQFEHELAEFTKGWFGPGVTVNIRSGCAELEVYRR